MSAARRAASTWVMRRGIGEGDEWQCMSTAPWSTRSTAVVPDFSRAMVMNFSLCLLGAPCGRR